MAPPRSEDGDSSADDSHEFENLVTLESINQRMTINSAITSDYAGLWGPVEAFREVVQNWRDGIIKSFKMSEADFVVVREDKGDNIVFKAMNSDSSRRRSKSMTECLGYIRWSSVEGKGVVEVTNRQATLQPWHLDMGGSSKKGDANQAGFHGEGLKVALLILMRRPQNHAVRCYSGGFSWTFNFTNQRKLVTCLIRMKPRAIIDARDQAESDVDRGLLPTATSPNQDVQFLIGGTARGRDDNGYPTERDGVTRAQFLEWTKAALFLQITAHDQCVATARGDLLLSPRFQGRIYLKGLLLKASTPNRSASRTGKPLAYGYNFANGITNRERESMATAKDETRAILSIWQSACAKSPDPDGIIRTLHEMLNSDNPDWADVARADSLVKPVLAQFIKRFILSKEFEGKWFHTSMEKAQNIRFDQIMSGFRREPVKLTDSYWRILEANGFRTASDEERKRFAAANAIELPDNSFAKAVQRAVAAGLRACPLIAGWTIQFVGAGDLGLDSFYDDRTGCFKIHERWLKVPGAQEELGLARSVPEGALEMYTSKRLLANAIAQIPASKIRDHKRTSEWYRKRLINQSDQRITEYCQIKEDLRFSMKLESQLLTLKVHWNRKLGWISNEWICVEIHSESSCSQLKKCLVASELNRQKRISPTCGVSCRSDYLRVSWGGARYPGLSTEAGKYFLLVCQSEDSWSIPDSLVMLIDEPQIAETPREPRNSTNDQDAFRLGDRLDSLDVMTARDWYQGSNSLGTKAVIGIDKNEAQGAAKSGEVNTPSKRPLSSPSTPSNSRPAKSARSWLKRRI
ncbi:hypothetical protein F4780DRAFT_794006 [Xylariomycetidae sp. FL0641]|nr:hypothetical protein F4780DRAFT_794006 [Xylariomycetidae sp. FL0641]